MSPARMTASRATRMVLLLLIALVAPAAPPAAPPSKVAAEDTAHLVRYWQQEWPHTDFSRTTVPLGEILAGGPPKDGIPPIDKPAFVPVAQADAWLEANEPVLAFVHGGEARAYPLQILIWHEIVNDTVAGQPITVTFCPLCNSALVFDRRLEGRVLDFGTTGKLRKSDLVMWDRQTESWWQQLTGEAIVGALAGKRLTYLPAPLVRYGTFRESYPQGRVLSRETGHQRNYGANPYVHYDDPATVQPFLLKGSPDPRLAAMERVVALEVGAEAVAYPYARLARVGVVNDRVGGRAVLVIYRGGTRSALDQAAMARSRDVGTGVVFERTVRGRELTFAQEGDRLVDRETGTRWSLLGQGIAGPLRGAALTPLPHGNHFAFAWLAFRPRSRIWQAPAH